MIKWIKKMIQDKKAYKNQMARVELLPEDYQFVFKKIEGYLWSFAGGDGSDMLKAQQELIELFEMTAREGKHVLEVTGEDVTGFCDEFIKDTKKWTDHYREKLSCKVLKKLEAESNE